MADLLEYEMFVDGKTSEPSKDFDAMIARLHELRDIGDKLGVRIPQLLTAADGIAAEGGEFVEIVKKMKWQGKPLDEHTVMHLRKELGDLMFYAMVACTALGITGDEVIQMNKDKLNGRYKDGFTVEESENRAEGDL